jgi:hypothetical protein
VAFFRDVVFIVSMPTFDNRLSFLEADLVWFTTWIAATVTLATLPPYHYDVVLSTGSTVAMGRGAAHACRVAVAASRWPGTRTTMARSSRTTSTSWKVS